MTSKRFPSLSLLRGVDYFQDNIMKTCVIPNCSENTAGYSKLCEKHKRTQRRHGDPEQEGITVADIKPYISRVMHRIEKNADNPTWSLLAQRWNKLIEVALDKQESYSSGKPTNRIELQAFNEIAKLKFTEPKRIMEVYIAMYLLASEQPRRFKSDQTFLFQLARRIRTLTDSNAGQYWDNETKKAKRVYRDISPRVLKLLGELLVETFGAAGLFIAKLEAEEARKLQQDKADLEAALRSLK